VSTTGSAQYRLLQGFSYNFVAAIRLRPDPLIADIYRPSIQPNRIDSPTQLNQQIDCIAGLVLVAVRRLAKAWKVQNIAGVNVQKRVNTRLNGGYSGFSTTSVTSPYLFVTQTLYREASSQSTTLTRNATSARTSCCRRIRCKCVAYQLPHSIRFNHSFSLGVRCGWMNCTTDVCSRHTTNSTVLYNT